MANQPLGQVHGVRLAVTKLDAAGLTPAGAANRYVSSSLVTLKVTPNITDPVEIRETNAENVPCVHFRGKPIYNWYDWELVICTPDPFLMNLLAGGSVLQDAAGGGVRPAGYAYPQLGVPIDPGDISIEVWGKRVFNKVLDPLYPYQWHVLPRNTEMRLGERTVGNNAILPVVTGIAIENTGWGNGPLNNWPTGVASDRGYFSLPITAAELPADGGGAYVTVPVQT